MEDKDYYKLLGITDEEQKLDGEEFSSIVKKKFRKLSVQYHPDKQCDKTEEEKKEAEIKFKEINEANSVLSDPNKRREYDFKRNGFESFNQFGFGHSMGDFFSFGKEKTERGLNLHVTLSLTIEDVINGTTKNIKGERLVKCKHCGGTGSNDSKIHHCTKCNGNGFIVQTIVRGIAMYQHKTICQDCNGTGTHIIDKCKKCGGSGLVSEEFNVSVEIPKGTYDGAIFTVKGLGNESKLQGNHNGDVFVHISIENNDKFKIDGLNIIYELGLDLDEALCGCEKEFVTVDNKKIKIKIPELTEDGKVFRVKSLGVPNLIDTKQRGDLLIVIFYKKITKITNKQKKLIKEFYGRK